jgi:hypothetical protein
MGKAKNKTGTMICAPRSCMNERHLRCHLNTLRCCLAKLELVHPFLPPGPQAILLVLSTTTSLFTAEL